MFKRYTNNPFFWLLLLGNLYCIWYFSNYSNGFVTVVWIYWMQSIIIGLFNFIDLLTIKQYDAAGFKVNEQPLTEKNKGCLPWFFLLHYGMFHFVYMIFLGVQLGFGVDRLFLLVGVGAFLLEALMAFIRRKQAEETLRFNMGGLFFLPYLRVVPMHLMIMGPAFLGWQPSVIFLVLKTIADMLSFMIYQRMWDKAVQAAQK